MARTTLVVAGVLEREGLVLICQRRDGQRHPLKWEFPGGKVERGEEPRRALERELREELDIEAQAGEEIGRYEYRYPQRGPILLIFYRVTEFQREPRNLEFQQIVWVEPRRLLEYDFLEGDRDFIRRLARGEV